MSQAVIATAGTLVLKPSRCGLAAILFAVSQAGVCRDDALVLDAAIVGIDHMPTAVRQLVPASEDYQKLGFALKPGRVHPNGLRNNHVKFEDGAGIELISPPEAPTDSLSKRYAEFLKDGEGPAHIAFHARNTEALVTALRASGLKVRNDDGGTQLDEPLLDFLFFVQDNRSPTDKPAHFAHANSAKAMTGVWLALDEASRTRLRQLLIAFGAAEKREQVFAPHPVEADVFAVQNGRVVVLPASSQTRAGRPIVGAEFEVRDIGRAPCDPPVLADAVTTDATTKHCVISPSRAHGIWLEFHAARTSGRASDKSYTQNDTAPAQGSRLQLP